MTDDENSDKWHLRDLQPQAFMKKTGFHPNLSTSVEFSLTNQYQSAQAPQHVSLASFSSVEVGHSHVPCAWWCSDQFSVSIDVRLGSGGRFEADPHTSWVNRGRSNENTTGPLKFNIDHPKIRKVAFQPSCFQGRAVKLQRCGDINKLEAFACTMRHHVWKNTHADASQNITHKRKMRWKSLWVSKKLAVLKPQLKPG